MRLLVVGLGVQGRKRLRAAGKDAVGTVDPTVADARWKRLADVPPDAYDAAALCVPDSEKPRALGSLLGAGKHVLVEKPLFLRPAEFDALQRRARRAGAYCMTAYNHRFEPHFARMRETIASGQLGKIYRCRMFYGNGTAELVRDSAWRDHGDGVLSDLGSHLLDTLDFWFGDLADGFHVVSANRFENRAPDHVVVASEKGLPKIELEMTLLAWRNHFTCDVFAENGSAHIASLCKWGPSEFVERRRVRPSGRPPETTTVLTRDDPTWAAEYAEFKRRVARGARTDFGGDRRIGRTLERLGKAAIAMARKR
ncbi:MAG: Gfo/Idh/MocA family oxidoreductase [Tagaea sp.]|nr:Gfo/Idh/MocA family oxidoreductase [Tagaea sp.]